MDSSQVLVAPGVRTLPRSGVRARLSNAVAIVAGQPRLWLLGAAGFMLRGGIVVLMAPIMVLPTQVEVRLMLGDYLGTTGFTPAFYGLLLGAAVLAGALLVAIVVILARLELAMFHLIGDPLTAHDARQPRTALVTRMVTVQVWTVIALLLAALPLAFATGEAAYSEVLRPSSSAPILERIFSAVTLPLAVFLVAFGAVEALSAAVSRRLLVAHARKVGPTGLLRAAAEVSRGISRSPRRWLVASAAGWLIAIAAVVPVVTVVAVTWQPVRRAFLSSVGMADALEPRTLLAAVVLAGSLAIGLVVIGFASAVRSAVWTLDSTS